MRAATLRTSRLVLEPVTGENAERLAADLVPALAATSLYRHIGGRPPTEAELVERHQRWATGESPDGREWWLNWALRRLDDRVAVGTLQGAVPRVVAHRGADGALGGGAAMTTVAWVVGEPFQGRGYAGEAAAAVLDFLRVQGVTAVGAWIHPDNRASQAVARRLGMRRTGAALDGEDGWAVTLTPVPG